MKKPQTIKESDFLFYKGADKQIKIQVMVAGESVWCTQKGLSEVFSTSRENITIHLKNIFQENELDENSVCKEILHTADDGKNYKTKFYNLDAIISVGYRVNSYQATQFRKWATRIIKEYMIKGFALDDERLKQGKTLFGKDYFDELLERIKEIRASERRFYQKITDIYAQCSIDYDKDSPLTQTFYGTVQNKLHYAITGQTAAEIVVKRVDSDKVNMGLTTWKNAPKGKIMKTDVNIAKNYLSEDEMSHLNSVVTAYLDHAELQARKRKALKMEDWIHRLDAFLRFNEYDILLDAGKISAKLAKEKSYKEFKKFRVFQDKTYRSDFDEVVDHIKETGELPEPTEKQTPDLSPFNKSLKTALDYNPKEDR